MHPRPITEEHAEAGLLQRDIAYALILPFLQGSQHAVRLAMSMLGDRRLFDLELAFRGEARGAFAWLQALMTAAKDWCKSRGCPSILNH